MSGHLLGSNLSIGISMSGHLLGSLIGGIEDLQVVVSSLLKVVNLLMQGLDLIKAGRLGETLSSGSLSTHQPGSELLDASPVLGPELDIVGVLVALNLSAGSQVGDILGDPGKLILVGLGISRNLVSLGQKSLLSLSILLQDLNLGSNVLLEVHGPGNTVLRQHGARGFLDVLQLLSGLCHPF